ncbi:hypothetical protein BDZ89DRAFT_1158513 [Hymenopellis radicata]|nr:hypothetical protein BDZ89DRAFT_1158513 [Hymenopellis radicata]
MARPANKRRKITAANKENKAPRVSRGGRKTRNARCLTAANFTDLPFDVLLEIAAWLIPLDLLYLCRVNHALRNVFMTKASHGAWKQARANANNLPEPFAEISEPAWANLVYVRVCNFCWKKKVMEPDFRLRCRICAKCSETHLLALKEFLDVMPVADRPDIEMIFNLIPSNKLAYQRQKVHDTYVRLTDYEDIENEIRQLPKGLTDAFRKEKLRSRKKVVQHAQLCEDWLDERTSAREAELKAAGKQRRKAILDRLSSMGYENEVKYMIAADTDGFEYCEFRFSYKNFMQLPQVKQNSVLTDRVWRNIEAGILEFMVGVRTRYLEHENTLLLRSRTVKAVSVFRSFKEALPPHTLFPYIPDFLALDVVHDLIHRPDHTALTEEDFTEVCSEMDSFADNWRYSVHRQLAQAVGLNFAESHPDIDTLSTDLKLAATGIICASCTRFPIDFSPSAVEKFMSATTLEVRPLFYPEVLTHRCAVSTMLFPGFYPDWYFLDGSSVKNLLSLFRSQWRPGPYAKHPVVARLARKVVTMTGLDASSATVNDMDGCGVLFECTSCRESARRVLFSWREIMQHAMVEHIVGSADFEQRVSPVRTSELPEGWDVTEMTYEEILYECLHCRDTLEEEVGGIEHEKMMKHLLDKHQLQNPRENMDYESLLGSPTQARPRCVQITLKKRAQIAQTEA